MALRASHLTKAHRMNGRQIELLALLLVALETDFRLSYIREYGVPADVNLVATGTGDISVLMATAFPVDMLIVMMAGEAHAVLFLDRFIRLESKIQYRWSLFSPPDSTDMPTPVQGLLHRRRASHARAVTGFALQLRKWRTFIALLTVLGFENIEYRIVRIFIMTFDTGVSAFFSKDARLHIFHGSRHPGCWGWGWFLLLLLLLRPAGRIKRKPKQKKQ